MSEQDDLAFAGVARQAELVRTGEVSSRELTSIYLARIDRLDPQLNAYRTVMTEKALAEADAADARRVSEGDGAPALNGVPIAIKDNLDVTGELTCNGTAVVSEPAMSDSPIVARLREAGCVLLGKTNLSELASYMFVETDQWGITRNPWNTEHSPAGSSGGSGAAAAAGLCAAASTNDGAGSTRVPAAWNGLFGLKPQAGRIPHGPNDVDWNGMAAEGFATQTVLDQALLFDATSARSGEPGPPPPKRPFAESAKAAPGKLRIALSAKPVRAAAKPVVSDDVKRALSAAGDLLRSLGHDVEEADPDLPLLVGSHISTRYLRGVRDDMHRYPKSEYDRFEPYNRSIRRLGNLITDWYLRGARKASVRNGATVNAIFDDHDVLVTPVVGETAVKVGRWSPKRGLRTLLPMTAVDCFAPLWNHLGNPAFAVPMGLSGGKLPLSVQLVGRPNDEATLFSLAAQMEPGLPPLGRPPVS